MGYVIPPGFSRVVFEYSAVSTVGSKPNWGFGLSLDPDLDTLNILAAWAEDDLIPETFGLWHISRITMRSDLLLQELDVDLTGDRSGIPQAPQVCALVKAVTGSAGRTNRGRWYWPGVLGESDLSDSGSINGSRLTALGDLIVSLADALEPTGGHPVVLHSSSSDPTPITGLQVQTQIATQRRRNRG